MAKAAVLIVIFAALGFYFYQVALLLEPGKINQISSNTCTALRGPRGVEDLLTWEEFVIGTNIDAIPVFVFPNLNDPTISMGTNAPPGYLYVISGVGSDSPILKKAEIIGFPKGVISHPHAIGLHQPTNTLFVLNHAFGKGGERVDTYKLSRSKGNVRMTYKSSLIFDPLAFMGSLNDLVPVSETEFYITQYRVEPDRTNGRSLSLKSKLVDLLTVFSLQPWTKNYFCNSTSGESQKYCKAVGPGGRMWNGITASPDGKTIYVNDVLSKTITAFSRTKDNDLKTERVYALPHIADNLQWDVNDGQVWMAGLSIGWQGFRYLHGWNNHPNVWPTFGKTPDGYSAQGHVSSLDPVSGKVTTHFIHDGKLLGGFSAGIKFQNKLVIGSFVDDGVLICNTNK